MCRWLVYFGDRMVPANLLYYAEHALIKQSENSEVHTPTVFVNPYRQVANASAPQLKSPDPRLSPPMWAQRSFFPVEEGDLVVFPAFVEHMVLKQKSDEFRITLSFNFNFV